MPLTLSEYDSAAQKIRGVARRPGVEPFTPRLGVRGRVVAARALGARMDFPVIWVRDVQLELVADPARVWNGPRR